MGRPPRQGTTSPRIRDPVRNSAIRPGRRAGTNSSGQKGGAQKTESYGEASKSQSKQHNAGTRKAQKSEPKGEEAKKQSQDQNAGANKTESYGEAAKKSNSQRRNAGGTNTTGQASKSQQNSQNAGTAAPKAAPQSNQPQSRQANTAAQPKGVKLTAQQQTKVRQTVFASNNVPRVEHVDFSVDVGTVVPHRVHVVTVPQRLVEIYPEWRGDEYFVVRDEIVIVDHDRTIVAVIPAGEHRAAIGSSTTIVNLPPDEIREVQVVLIRKGFLHGDADGIFGPRTSDALIEFQRREGLRATGHIDPRTVSSLGLSNKVQLGGAEGESGNKSSTVGQAPSERNASRQANRPSKSENARSPRPNERSTTGQGRSARPNANENQQSNRNEMGNRSAPSTTGQGHNQPGSTKQDEKVRHKEKSDYNK